MRTARCQTSARRAGFTSLELVIAIAIGAMIVLATRELVERLDKTDRMVQSRTHAELRRFLAEDLLRSVVGQIETQRDMADGTPMSFAGTPTRAEFTSWCEVPAAWEERCRVELRIVATPAGKIMQMSSPLLGTLIIDSLPRDARFAYLLDPGYGGRWLARWDPAPFAPPAIGVMTASDTLILRVGSRD